MGARTPSMSRKITRRTTGRALALRLSDEEGDPPRRLRLVFLVRGIGGDGELPQPRPLGLVLDFARPHRLDGGAVAELDRGVGAKVVHPDRVLRRASERADEDVVAAVLDTHQRGLAGGSRLVAGVRDDHDGQPGVAERGALGPTAPLVELDLVA